jgi:hypothetical protein
MYGSRTHEKHVFQKNIYAYIRQQVEVLVSRLLLSQKTLEPNPGAGCGRRQVLFRVVSSRLHLPPAWIEAASQNCDKPESLYCKGGGL